MLTGTAVAPSSRMTQQPDDDLIVYEILDAWEIRIGDELHGLRFTLEAALEHARGLAAFHPKRGWLLEWYRLRQIERDTLHCSG